MLPVQYFSVNGVSATIVPLPTMEANKDFELVFELARRMEEFKLNRWVSFCIAGIALMALLSSMCLLAPLQSHRVTFALSVRFLPAWQHIAQLHLLPVRRRKEPIIAIGGGVCLDVCGLAANLYRRNTPVIKVQTFLHCFRL